jgi:hypothetical protein
MKFLTREKSKVLAERNGWSHAHAEGYIDGERARRRGTAPPKYALVGIDDYCRGFRAGYFATDRNQPNAETKAR